MGEETLLGDMLRRERSHEGGAAPLIKIKKKKVEHTSLGEESAEAMVGITLLAFLGQVSIGLRHLSV